MEQQEWYTAAEVAALYRAGASTVRKWINEDRIRAVRLPGGTYRIPAAEVARIGEWFVVRT